MVDDDLLRRADVAENDPVKHLHVDKCFNDNGEVFYMHLGRGAPKSFGGYKEEGKTYPSDWIAFADEHLFHGKKKVNSDFLNDLLYSLPRFYVDSFLGRMSTFVQKEQSILILVVRRSINVDDSILSNTFRVLNMPI